MEIIKMCRKCNKIVLDGCPNCGAGADIEEKPVVVSVAEVLYILQTLGYNMNTVYMLNNYRLSEMGLNKE